MNTTGSIAPTVSTLTTLTTPTIVTKKEVESPPPTAGDEVTVGKGTATAEVTKPPQTTPRDRIVAYFKDGEADTEALAKALGVPTKRDENGFLDVDRDAMYQKFTKTPADKSVRENVTQLLRATLKKDEAINPSPELAQFHKEAVEGEREALGFYDKTLSHLSDKMGIFKSLIFAKNMMSELWHSQQRDTALKSMAKDVCAQYGITPGKW